MSDAGGPPPDDAELAAYLRDELPLLRRAAVRRWLEADGGLRDRLATIAAAGRPARGGAARPARWRAAAAPFATGVAVTVLGFGAAHWLMPAPAPAPAPPAEAGAVAREPGGWRQTVAEYFSLDTVDSLAAITDDAAARRRELDIAAAKLGLALPEAALAVPGLVLKRADVFAFRRRPLAEILYLDPRYGPTALCIIANGKPDSGLRHERREGQNLVFWQRGGRGFLIIGRAPPGALARHAETVARGLAVTPL